MLRSSLNVKTHLCLPTGVHLRSPPCRVRTRSHTERKWDVNTDGPVEAKNVKDFYAKQGYNTASATFPNPFSTGRHRHKKDVYMITIAGEYVVDIDGETIKMGPGDVVNTPEGVEHEEHNPEETETTMVFATKDPDLLKAFQTPPT